ncbi:glycoside hydrolase [Corynascus novoguineensis]|uniref:lytic cellulose monooxygenase (C4-dehydrogenating) n=1 Tax=Corynascus novoguineensis TaxID=1126955 RepID=A0AAN7CPI1_9PEZI|nr:glycoside hydrolase [Corynascus novoguineensis]
MHPPFLLTLGLASLLAPLSSAHTTFTTLFIDDVNQGDGTCIRMAKEGNVATHPIAGGLDSKDMACGRNGQEAVAFTCPAAAGAKLTLEFRMWADGSQPGSIDPSHLGVMAIYLKKVSDIKSDAAAGPGWFKIWDEGYDTAAKKWATEKLIDDNGLLSVNLPSGLPTGYYLARQEIITIQNVTNGKPDPQFYVGCAQLYVEGGSDSSIPEDKTVSIPGHIDDPADPGLTFNVYEGDGSTYKTPGPKVYFPTGGNNNKRRAADDNNDDKKKETDGLVPTDCLVKNANWCATTLTAYTDEAGCWAAAEECYEQLDTCYNSAPPSGSKGCKVWEEQVCAVVSKGCESGDFKGPPNFGDTLGDKIDQPIPGGKLPPAVNAGAGGDGDDGEEGDAASTPTQAAADTAEAPKPKLHRTKRRASGRMRVAFAE